MDLCCQQHDSQFTNLETVTDHCQNAHYYTGIHGINFLLLQGRLLTIM